MTAEQFNVYADRCRDEILAYLARAYPDLRNTARPLPVPKCKTSRVQPRTAA